MNREENILITGCSNRDALAQKNLYELHAPTMMNVVKRFSKSYDDQCELLQLSFIKVFDSIHKFKGNGSLEGWIRRIVVNTSISYVKKNKNHAIDVDDIELEDIEIDESVQIPYDVLLSTLDVLDDRKRIIFNLFVFESYSHKEISEQLGITVPNSRSELTRARIALRKELKSHYKEIYC